MRENISTLRVFELFCAAISALSAFGVRMDFVAAHIKRFSSIDVASLLLLLLSSFFLFRALLDKKPIDKASLILQNIAQSHIKNDVSIWGIGKHISAGTVQIHDTWQEWIGQLIRATKRTDLEEHNFCDHFYLHDLLTGKSIEFPREKAARATKIGDSIPLGKVLWVSPKST